MTYFAVEQALWGISQDAEAAQAFISDPDAYLAQFNMSPEERNAVRDFEVRLLADSGVNPLLIMQSWNAVQGPGEIAE